MRVKSAPLTDIRKAMYEDPDGAVKPIEHLDAICSQIPVHIAFGEKKGVM